MTRFLGMLVLLAVGVLVLGSYQDWFAVSTTENSASDDMDVTVHIDRAKIKADARKAREKARNLRKNWEEKIDSWQDSPDEDDR
jgi:ABC-type protease/lipase transport system fused ATPase/permease subunit